MRTRGALAGVLLALVLVPFAWGCAITVLCLDSSSHKDASKVEHVHRRAWSVFGERCERKP